MSERPQWKDSLEELPAAVCCLGWCSISTFIDGVFLFLFFFYSGQYHISVVPIAICCLFLSCWRVHAGNQVAICSQQFIKKFELARSWWLGITTKRLQRPTVGEPVQCSLRWDGGQPGGQQRQISISKHLLWTFQNRYNIGTDLRKKKVLFVTPIFVLRGDQGLPTTHSETAQMARHKSPWHGHKDGTS